MLRKDGLYLLSGSWDCTARRWSMRDALFVRIFKGHGNWVTAADVSPNGKILATSSSDRTAKLWGFRTCKLLKTFEGHHGTVTAVCFTPDSRFLITASWDQTACLWDCATGVVTRKFLGHTGGITSACISSDGGVLVTGSADKTARLWQISDGSELRVLRGHHTNWVTAVKIVPSCPQRVDSFKPWWGTTKAGPERPAETESATARLLSNMLVVTCSDDRTARLWSAPNSTMLRCFRGHTDAIFDIDVTPDGKHLVTGSNDHSIKMWSIEVRSVTFAPTLAAFVGA